MQCRGAVGGELIEQPFPYGAGHGRAQVELGQRGSQVQAGAADDYRAPASGEQRVDLRVRQARVLTRTEGGVERQEGNEPVLERGALGGRRHTREDLEPGVHLQRVSGHGHGVLAACAQ